jgi:peptidoglycan/xylan/chitin deacetylase (PgdA/CDA1 family)
MVWGNGLVPTPSRVRAAVSGRSSRLWWTVQDGLAQVRRRLPEGSVGLTFDDGPQPGSTDRILDVLAELGVRGTFFCVGRNARAHPELVRRIRAEGHAVGSHSLSHPHPRDTELRHICRDDEPCPRCSAPTRSCSVPRTATSDRPAP